MKSLIASRARSFFALFTLAAAAAATSASCGSSGGGDTPPGAACASLGADCGKTCSITGDCVAGAYCNAGKCTADCSAAGGQCSSGQSCNAQGRCTTDSANGGTGGTGGSDPTFTVGAGNGSGAGDTSTSASSGCATVKAEFSPQIPTVVLLIDQSASMVDTFPSNGNQQRWNVVYDVLMNPTNGVVKTLQGKVRFGLALYTSNNGGPTCPVLTKLLPPALNSYDAINAKYKPAKPVDDTPTGDSINAIVPDLLAVTEPGPKLIVLATDGLPDSCADPDPPANPPTRQNAAEKVATDAAKAAYTKGIETVIIAVGDEVSVDHQQDMANAGKGLAVPADCSKSACAPTYAPASKQAMIDAFLSIVNGKRSCVFTLSGKLADGSDPCKGTVTVNGNPVACKDANGWDLKSPTEIEFKGTTCDTILKAADVNISADFPCDVFTPIPIPK